MATRKKDEPTAYRVTGAMVTAACDTIAGRQVRYFQAGVILPSSVNAETIEHLLDVGMIEPAEGVAAPDEAQDEEPGEGSDS